jgi:hypothetical protein
MVQAVRIARATITSMWTMRIDANSVAHHPMEAVAQIARAAITDMDTVETAAFGVVHRRLGADVRIVQIGYMKGSLNQQAR